MTLTMIMNNIIQVNSNATICQGQSYTFNGNTYTAGGSYSDTFTSTVGCDSITTLTLTVTPLPAAPITNPVTYCQDATVTPLTATGNNLLWYTTATGGTGTATAPTPSTATPGTTTWYVSQIVNGCEGPRAQLDVTIYATPTLPTVITPVIYCQNTTATTLSATGNNLLWYTTPTGGTGTATAPTPSTATPGSTTWYVSQTINGCEGPRAAIDVTIKPTTTGADTAQICPGASYTFGSQTITAAGTYTETFPAANGCDSVATLTMIMNNIIQVNSNATICQGQSYTFNGNTYTTAGSYSDTFTSAVGCDSITTLTLTVNPLPDAPDTDPVTYCQDDASAPLSAGGSNLRWYTTATGGAGTATAPTPSTAAVDTLTWYVSQTINGCEGPRVPLRVYIYPNPTVDAKLEIMGGLLYLNAQATGNGLSYAWTPPDGLSCTDCPRPEANPTRSTVYTIQVTSAAGCTTSDTIGVHLTCSRIFFPNTFTPDGDGNNDRFYPMGQSIERVKVFRIYNRWGELVYSRDNIQANDPTQGWDGTFQNRAVKPDVFVYYMEAICKTGETIFLKGDVTMLR